MRLTFSPTPHTALFVTGVHILGTESIIPNPDPLVFQVKGVGSDVTSGTIFDMTDLNIICGLCRSSVPRLAGHQLLI